jgi:hypothetical protein
MPSSGSFEILLIIFVDMPVFVPSFGADDKLMWWEQWPPTVNGAEFGKPFHALPVISRSVTCRDLSANRKRIMLFFYNGLPDF